MSNPFYARYIPPDLPENSQVQIESEIANLNLSPQKNVSDEKIVSRKKKKRVKLTTAEIGEESKDNDQKHKGVYAKYEKSVKTTGGSKEESEVTKEKDLKPDDSGQEAAKDIVPIPQPKSSPPREFRPSFSAVPEWISEPVKAQADHTAPFTSLGLDEITATRLRKYGYESAFAVQTAVLPLLLHGPRAHRGDLCISAATGSGKTLAYLVPIIQSVKGRPLPKLRTIIVAPTRELVAQIRDVAVRCAAGTSLQVGTAGGNRSMAAEQEQLIEKGKRYDPTRYKEMLEEAQRTFMCGSEGVDPRLREVGRMMTNFVPHYQPKVDILVCTPSRLTDHMRETVGFHLDDVQWLVIDEADRMMDRNFRLWAKKVMTELYSEKPASRMNVRDKFLQIMNGTNKEHLIRKIIVSATMTTNIAKLQLLQLERPKLVVLESTTTDETKPEANEDVTMDVDTATSADRYELPTRLKEWAIPVDDESYKPLYMLWILLNRIFSDEADGDTTSSSSSEEEMNDQSSDSVDSSPAEESIEGESHCKTNTKPNQENSEKRTSALSNSTSQHDVLVFTKSNESAARLAHLLSKLHPPYLKSINLLTKSSSHASRNSASTVPPTFRNRVRNRPGHAHEPLIIIASDRASLGLDTRSIAHVVNYDVPRDVTSYVHRAGRTARAGMSGECWTFLAFKEAGWFWNAIGRGKKIIRATDSNTGSERRIERFKIDVNEILNDEWKEKYENALQELKNAVKGNI